MEYTKGEWRAYKDKYVKGVTVTSSEGEICICDYKDGKGYANARLIATAPDLYEALKSLALVCRDVSYTHSELNKARQALSKVEEGK